MFADESRNHDYKDDVSKISEWLTRVWEQGSTLICEHSELLCKHEKKNFFLCWLISHFSKALTPPHILISINHISNYLTLSNHSSSSEHLKSVSPLIFFPYFFFCFHHKRFQKFLLRIWKLIQKSTSCPHWNKWDMKGSWVINFQVMKSYFFIGFYLCLNSIPRLSFFFSSNPVTFSMIAYLYFFVSFTSTSLQLLSSSSVFMQLFPSLFYLSLLLTSLFCNLSYSSFNLSSPNHFCHLF